MSRVLLDENFPRSTVAGLTAAGHDVLSIAATAPGLDDRGVLALAGTDGRCLLTFDADFGDLVFQHGATPPPAILYFRLLPVVAEEVLALALLALKTSPDGHFIVVTRDALRRRAFTLSDGGGAA